MLHFVLPRTRLGWLLLLGLATLAGAAGSVFGEFNPDGITDFVVVAAIAAIPMRLWESWRRGGFSNGLSLKELASAPGREIHQTPLGRRLAPYRTEDNLIGAGIALVAIGVLVWLEAPTLFGEGTSTVVIVAVALGAGVTVGRYLGRGQWR